MLRRQALVALAAVMVSAATACGGGDRDSGGARAPVEEPGLIHVHGLGVNPFDQALYIATHHGLFRAAQGEDAAKRVSDSRQDVMGFTVVGSDRFLASGHPDGRTDDHPLLGLIESGNAGKTWTSILLDEQADFHILRAGARTLYAYDSHQQRLLTGPADGTGLSQRENPPGDLFDLAVDPEDADELVAATDRGLARSRDGARSWTMLDRKRTGMLVALAPKRLLLVGATGTVETSDDRGRSWKRGGSIGGQPAALHARDDIVYAAVVDGPILQSADAGRTWQVRVKQ